MFNPTLDRIVSSLSGTVLQLERFMENKNQEIIEHIRVINEHQGMTTVKQNEVDRAARIRTKLNDLLK